MSGIVLAFDFGLRRIGVAAGNRLTRTASPVATLEIGAFVRWELIDAIVGDWAPDLIVVGMPESARAAALAAQVRQFVQELANRYKLPVRTVDESLTSEAARTLLADRRRSGTLRRRLGKGAIDKHAACLIAEQWMSENNEHG